MKLAGALHRKLIGQFFKFGLVGVIGLGVDITMLAFCMDALGMGPYLGRVFSFIVAASTTWICNRLFTFRGEGQGSPGAQWMKFLIVSAGGFILNYGTYAALIAGSPLVRQYPSLGVAAGSLAGMFFNFFVSRRVVFR